MSNLNTQNIKIMKQKGFEFSIQKNILYLLSALFNTSRKFSVFCSKEYPVYFLISSILAESFLFSGQKNMLRFLFILFNNFLE